MSHPFHPSPFSTTATENNVDAPTVAATTVYHHHSTRNARPLKRRKTNHSSLTHTAQRNQKSNLVCPYQFTPSGCQSGPQKCQYRHVASRQEANRMKLRFMLGQNFDEEVIENALRVLDEEAKEQVSALEQESKSDQQEDEDMALSDNDVNNEDKSSYALDEDGEPLYFNHVMHEQHQLQQSTQEANDAKKPVASMRDLFKSVQRSLCGKRIDRDVFERERNILGEILGEVQRDLNVKSTGTDESGTSTGAGTPTTSASASVCYDVGTAVFDEEGLIIGIVSEVIGNIRAPNYRVSVPQHTHKSICEVAVHDAAAISDVTTDTDDAAADAPLLKDWVNFDTVVKLQDLVDKEATVYVIPKYANTISDPKINKQRLESMVQTLKSEHAFVPAPVASESGSSTHVDLSSLPQDVQYITSLLRNGPNAYAASEAYSSMWVSDDPNLAISGAPSSPKHDDEMPEAIFEDAEAEKLYMEGERSRSATGRGAIARSNNNASGARGRGKQQHKNSGRGSKNSRKRTRDDRDAPYQGRHNIHRTQQRSYGSNRFKMPETRKPSRRQEQPQEEKKGFFQNYCIIS